MEIANHYAHERNIPRQNLVYLDVPEAALQPAATVTLAEFMKHIYEPAASVMTARGLDTHVLAWVYAPDFPTRIAGDPPISLQGATFVRGVLPSADEIRKGRYASILFAGPDSPDHPGSVSRSLDRYAEHYGKALPLPSMLLGVAGARGMEPAAILEHLKRARSADAAGWNGTVYFRVNDSIRSTCRAWQYPGAAAELRALGVPTVISSNVPPAELPLAGLFMGVAWVEPKEMGRLLPGSVGDHLTSGAGNLDLFDQTKLTVWLQAGAAAAGGAVIEPYAVWTKFPHGRFFAHYASGCSILESYCQSIRCPLQILLVGDPLVAPAAKRLALAIRAEPDKNDTSRVRFHFNLSGAPARQPPVFDCYLDGNRHSKTAKAELELDVSGLADGYHELRVVAVLPGPVGFQAHAVHGFVLNRRARGVEILDVKSGAVLDAEKTHLVSLRAKGESVSTLLVCDERVVAGPFAGAGGTAVLDPAVVGLGPVRIEAQAEYADGEVVRSAPVTVFIRERTIKPRIAAVEGTTNEQGRVTWRARVEDPSGGDAEVQWWQEVWRGAESDAEFAREKQSYWTVAGGQIEYRNTNDPWEVHTLPWLEGDDVVEYRGIIHVHADWISLRDQLAGLVFGYRNAKRFSYFGFDGARSAWVLGECDDGKLKDVVARGAPVRPAKDYSVTVRRRPSGEVECLVDGKVVLTADKEAWPEGGLGLLAGGQRKVIFRELLTAPPLPRKSYTVTPDGQLAAPLGASGLRVSAGVDGRLDERALPR